MIRGEPTHNVFTVCGQSESCSKSPVTPVISLGVQSSSTFLNPEIAVLKVVSRLDYT